MEKFSETAPPRDVADIDRQIFELVNRVRVDPKLFIPHL